MNLVLRRRCPPPAALAGRTGRRHALGRSGVPPRGRRPLNGMAQGGFRRQQERLRALMRRTVLVARRRTRLCGRHAGAGRSAPDRTGALAPLGSQGCRRAQVRGKTHAVAQTVDDAQVRRVASAPRPCESCSSRDRPRPAVLRPGSGRAVGHGWRRGEEPGLWQAGRQSGMGTLGALRISRARQGARRRALRLPPLAPAQPSRTAASSASWAEACPRPIHATVAAVGVQQPAWVLSAR